MTDTEIINALEEFHHRILKTNLSYHIRESEMMAIVDAIDLINRQKAEIERLHSFETYRYCRKNAIKEFAERLKEEACGNDLFDRSGFYVKAVTIEDIDNVKKEMEGEK